MLQIENLVVSYGKAVALQEISLRVEEGELVALLGSNGAGKSTLLKTISGMMGAGAGSIKFEEQELTALPAHKIVEMGVIQVPEGREVFPQLTVRENLRMGAFTRRDMSAVERDMQFVFELFPRLAERGNQMAGTLSGGEGQMLAIARALLSKPKLLMLDEPSLGLAPVVRDDIYEVVRQIYEERGVTILLVEQNAKWALEVASRGYILENGRVTLEGQGSKLAENEHVQRAYLGY
jgi:branched-chain amino acid transport system ATP-binding protein